VLRLVGLASITVTFLAASAAPTPLYATYQKAWGFSALTTTVVFGVYAVALLAALLTAGRLSDHIGRRPVVLAGIAGQILAMAVFADARSAGALMAARIAQGLAAGAAIGAVGAGMIDIDQPRGAVANATAPGIGTASGALLTSFAVQWLPAPTHLVYVVLAAVLAAQAFGVVLLPETSPRAPGAWRSLVPQVALPAQTRRPLLAAAPVLFAVWALAGFYGSLGPALIGHLAGTASVVDAGLGLGILAGVAAVTTYVLRATPAPSVMLIGTGTLIAGVATVLLALWAGSPLGFFAGTAVAGFGFGAGFQGGIRLVAPLARPDQRAGVLSVLYTVSYLGLGIPAVAAGLAVVRGGGLIATSYEYGVAVIALAAFATLNLIRLRTRNHASTEEVSMTDARPRKTPGPDHPIRLEPSPSHVLVRSGFVVIAETDRALEMREASYPPVLYIPLDDVDQRLLRRSDLHSYCPYKGEASYYDIVGENGTDLTAAVWYYDDPFPAVAGIKGHVAFYADRVTVTALPRAFAVR
jgi:uncharacterized protein (DUF427 family)/predicted MFS family arabinose efflux permease